jgi:hypothetical protein
MRARSSTWAASILGLVAGVIAGTAAVALVGSAVAQRAPAIAPEVLEATHFPPLLTLPGERVDLTFDVHCAAPGTDDPEAACAVSGTLFARAAGRREFSVSRLTPRVEDGLRQLTAVASDQLTNPNGFEYYAELVSEGGRRITVPAGGADAPYRVRTLLDAVEVSLGVHAFGKGRAQAERVASAPWGDGPADAGLEGGRNLAPIGASAFDVDPRGNVILLDQAHRRLLQWESGRTTPVAVPVSIDGRLADLARADDGSIYVVESVGRGDLSPVIRRFDADGRELDVVEAADRTPSQIRIGQSGPVVLQQPSNQWMPVAAEGAPVAPAEQHRQARSGRPLRGGGEVVVLRRGNEIRLALLRSGAVHGSWRVTSTTPLAEVQLAEPIGHRLLVVVRVYGDARDEFEVLLLDRRGLAQQISLSSADWAEAAPLGRFRLVGNALYRLGSDPAGAFVDRVDLGAQG